MNRRVVKQGCGVEGCREIRPSVRRHFGPGTVLNILQWVQPEMARFTIEGEGIEVWSCPQSVLNEQTESPQRSVEKATSI
jgi:hypothetical protein